MGGDTSNTLQTGILGPTVIKSASGLLGFGGGEEAAEASKEATEAAERTALKQLQFEQQRYKEWKAVYGSIQENLGQFYQNLEPDQVISLGLQQQQQQFQEARREIEQVFAERGLAGSGLETSTLTDLEILGATERARIHLTAPEIVRQQQSQFLALGLGQSGALQQGISSAFAGVRQSQQLTAQLQSQRALVQEQAERQFLTSALGATIGFIAGGPPGAVAGAETGRRAGAVS
jgi:hypothetical protein